MSTGVLPAASVSLIAFMRAPYAARASGRRLCKSRCGWAANDAPSNKKGISIVKDSPAPVQSSDLNEQFIEALQKGLKDSALRIMNEAGFDADAEEGLPLKTAIELGFLDIATRLMENGANPNAGAGHAKCAITLALENEYFDLADVMLGQGAEISIRDQKGWTPLIWAAIKGRKNVVEFLIEREADIHICCNDGWNAITGAFFKNHALIVEILAANGAKFGAKYQEAALLSAYEHGSTGVVKNLIADGVSVNIGIADGQPLLILAIARGDREMIDLLLDAGADVNIRDTNGNPALVSAIANAQYSAAARLVAQGASVNVKGPRWSAIHLAALHGQAELCQSLLNAGASIDQLGDASHTALMLAAKEEHAGTVKLLLEHGADPNRKNKKGESPYALAPFDVRRETPTRAALRQFGGK